MRRHMPHNMTPDSPCSTEPEGLTAQQKYKLARKAAYLVMSAVLLALAFIVTTLYTLKQWVLPYEYGLLGQAPDAFTWELATIALLGLMCAGYVYACAHFLLWKFPPNCNPVQYAALSGKAIETEVPRAFLRSYKVFYRAPFWQFAPKTKRKFKTLRS